MRRDDGGQFWDTFFDVVSLTISIIDVINNPQSASAWAGLTADVVCLITPGLTGGGTAVKAITKTDDVVDIVKATEKADNVIDTAKAIYKSADINSNIRTATGSYEVLYKSGKTYGGKGGFKRAITSAQTKATLYTDEVVSLSWKSAENSRMAFIDEYKRMSRLGGPNNNEIQNINSYNKIWSPGRKYYIDDLKNLF